MKLIDSGIRYIPSPTAMSVLIKGNIIAPGEEPQHMFERVVDTLFSVETDMGIPEAQTRRAAGEFAQAMADKWFTPGTPTLTNAGRPGYEHAALSSCAIIPADLRKKGESESIIKAYYRQNMGSGFDLTPYENPVELLLWLNDMAVKETKEGGYDRYIGNMANLHISHPAIRQFIALKKTRALPHFNCSVVVTDAFMEAAIRDETFPLSDGTKERARDLLQAIAESTWVIGDPSIINLERMNRDNPVADMLPYISAPPCAEMGLSKGETCQFIYINISKFCAPGGIDYSRLDRIVRVIVRALDNAVEYGITRYPSQTSMHVAKLKRKIGIAVSGIADTLLFYGIPYGSNRSLALVRDIVSFINFVSKEASVALAVDRGPCGAMRDRDHNAYYRDYLKRRYHVSTATVSATDWEALSDRIKSTGLLRNILTVTQPPAARVSLLMDCSFGIEPLFGYPAREKDFSLPVRTYVQQQYHGNIRSLLRQVANDGTFRDTPLSEQAKLVLRTATELSPSDHIAMVAALAGKDGVIDETASKTVNLPKTATVSDVFDTFLLAHQKGLKNISLYRDGSYENQPYSLTKK